MGQLQFLRNVVVGLNGAILVGVVVVIHGRVWVGLDVRGL